MKEVTYVSSRAVSKRRAADDAESRPSKRVQPKAEVSSDASIEHDSDTENFQNTRGIVRIGTEPFTEQRLNDLSQYMRKVEAALLTEKDSERRRNLSRQHMQAYILQLEATLENVTQDGDPSRAVLDQAVQYKTEWALQTRSPYGLWAASRDALLERIEELEGHWGARLTCSTEALEKIAQLEAEVTSAKHATENVKKHYRERMAKMSGGRYGMQSWSQEQDEEILDLRAQIDKLTEDYKEQKRLAQEAQGHHTFSIANAQRKHALQSAIAERDQARVNAEKLKRQLQDLQRRQDDIQNTNESEESRQRLQEEKDAAKAALKISKTENKDFRRTQRNLQAQIEERDAEIEALKLNGPAKESKKGRSAVKEAQKQAESAKQATRQMYNHYDTLHSKNMILIGKYEMLGRLLNVGAPGSSFRKELDGLKAPALNKLEEYEYEE